MQQLIATVQRHQCDVGLAFDGDGDRLGAVDREGRILYGDQLMILFARDVLQRHPQATIIADVKASQTLFDDVAKHGGTPLMWKTGHSLVKAKMKETGALLAGEMSGHLFFADEYFGFDDGIYAAIRMMNLLAHHSQPLEEMVTGLPACFSTPEIRIDVPDSKKFSMVEGIQQDLKQSGANASFVDGVRVNTEDGWWLMRASNTQPALVVRAESHSQDSLKKLRKMLQTQLEKVGIEKIAALDS
jgi:phosphomannomutase